MKRSREIKFRVWNGEVMFYPDNYRLLAQVLYEYSPYRQRLMQFTGLHDRKGVEIYEGEILKTFDLYQTYFIVGYSSRSFELYDNADEVLSDEHNYWDRYEVVGNIYENPELLENL